MAQTRSSKSHRSSPHQHGRAPLRHRTHRSDGEAEPLSLAEELVDQVDQIKDDTNDRYEQIKQSDIHIAELQRMTMPQLIEEARNENLTDYTGIKKHDLVFKILK